ncbi:MAG: hypothetical protein ACLQUT_00550 [Thermoleophilia bacterium]
MKAAARRLEAARYTHSMADVASDDETTPEYIAEVEARRAYEDLYEEASAMEARLRRELAESGELPEIRATLKTLQAKAEQAKAEAESAEDGAPTSAGKKKIRYFSEFEQSGRTFSFAFEREVGDEGSDEPMWIEVGWEGQSYPVAVRVRVTKAGEAFCTGLLLGARPGDPGAESDANVSARSLRGIPLNDILLCLNRLSRARGYLRRPGEFHQTLEEDLERRRNPRATAPPAGLWTVPEALFGRFATPYRAPTLHPGRKGWSREHFEGVAAAYNEILKHNAHNPMEELAEQQHKSLPQVRRWVRRARELGIPVNQPPRGGAAKRKEQP